MGFIPSAETVSTSKQSRKGSSNMFIFNSVCVCVCVCVFLYLWCVCVCVWLCVGDVCGFVADQFVVVIHALIMT